MLQLYYNIFNNSQVHQNYYNTDLLLTNSNIANLLLTLYIKYYSILILIYFINVLKVIIYTKSHQIEFGKIVVYKAPPFGTRSVSYLPRNVSRSHIDLPSQCHMSSRLINSQNELSQQEPGAKSKIDYKNRLIINWQRVRFSFLRRELISDRLSYARVA